MGFVLTLLMGSVLTLLGFYLARQYPKTAKPHPCALWHDFVLIDVQNFPCAEGSATQVLKRCQRCGTHTVFYLAGNWSLQTLSRTNSEIAELDKMVQR